MTYKKFKEIIDTLKELSDRDRILYKHKVDLIEFESEFYFVINTLLKEQFGKDGFDWIVWFMYEKDFGRKKDFKAWDENKNEICKDIKGLFELVKNG